MAKKYKKYVTVGNDKGKPIRKWFYGDTITELKANILKYQRMLENASNPSFITFGTYTEQWKDAWKSNKSAQTREMYDITLDKFRDGVISTKKASQLMGHSEEVFLKTYCHIDDSKEDISRLYGEDSDEAHEEII